MVGPAREQKRKQVLRKKEAPPPAGWAVVPPSTYLSLRVKLAWTSTKPSPRVCMAEMFTSLRCVWTAFNDEPWDKEQFYPDVCRTIFCLLFGLPFCPLVQSLKANNNFALCDMRRGDSSTTRVGKPELGSSQLL